MAGLCHLHYMVISVRVRTHGRFYKTHFAKSYAVCLTLPLNGIKMYSIRQQSKPAEKTNAFLAGFFS